MAATDHLGPQFYNYRPAQEEGKEASDWLSTNEGHDWQLGNFNIPNSGMFTFKDDIEDSASRQSNEATWPEPHPWHDLKYKGV